MTKTYTREQLEQMDTDDLDRLAFGVAYGDRLTISPDKLHIKYPGDLENPEERWRLGGMAWAKSVKLTEPVEISVGEDGLLYLENGHHRWFAAKKTGRKLKAEVVSVDGKPIEKILGPHANPEHADTLQQLYEAPWTTRDRPKVSEPYRAPIIAHTSWVNEHGVPIRVQVLTNRTTTRWWLKFLIGDSGYMSKYLTTTSKAKAREWMDAVEGGWGEGRSSNASQNPGGGVSRMSKFVVFSQSGLPVGTVQAQDKESGLLILQTSCRRFGSSSPSSLYLYPYNAAGREIREAADRGVRA